MVRTRKITEAQFAYCRTCDHWLGCQYWSLSKSVAMHKRGTGHSVELFTLADIDYAQRTGRRTPRATLERTP